MLGNRKRGGQKKVTFQARRDRTELAVHYHRAAGIEPRTGSVNDQRKFYIEFEVVNYGVETARIIASNVSIHMTDRSDLPMSPPYLPTGKGRIAPEYGLIAGGVCAKIAVEFDEWIDARAVRAMNEGKLYVLGFVIYQNHMGISSYYRTAFCRRWSPERLRRWFFDRAGLSLWSFRF